MTEFLEPVPFIPMQLLPEAEREHARIIVHQLGHLTSFVVAFDAALALFDDTDATMAALYASKPPLSQLQAAIMQDRIRLMEDRRAKSRQAMRISNWKHIAARDAAMTLWHFLKALVAIKANFDQTPTFRKFAGASALSEIEGARKELTSVFKNIKGVRDSVSHTAELTDSPTDWNANAIKEDYATASNAVPAGSFWLNNLENRSFSTTTFGGKIVSYELSGESARILHSVAVRTINAFREAERVMGQVERP